MRAIGMGPRYRFTETQPTLEGVGGVAVVVDRTRKCFVSCGKFWRWGGSGNAGKLAPDLFLSSCSLKLYRMKGYAGGLGASAFNASISGY